LKKEKKKRRKKKKIREKIRKEKNIEKMKGKKREKNEKKKLPELKFGVVIFAGIVCESSVNVCQCVITNVITEHVYNFLSRNDQC